MAASFCWRHVRPQREAPGQTRVSVLSAVNLSSLRCLYKQGMIKVTIAKGKKGVCSSCYWGKLRSHARLLLPVDTIKSIEEFLLNPSPWAIVPADLDVDRRRAYILPTKCCKFRYQKSPEAAFETDVNDLQVMRHRPIQSAEHAVLRSSSSITCMLCHFSDVRAVYLSHGEACHWAGYEPAYNPMDVKDA